MERGKPVDDMEGEAAGVVAALLEVSGTESRGCPLSLLVPCTELLEPPDKDLETEYGEESPES